MCFAASSPGRTAVHQGDAGALLSRVRRLYLLKVAARYPAVNPIHLVMDNCSETPQGDLVVEPIHGALHPPNMEVG
jgi:hypothetical protein